MIWLHIVRLQLLEHMRGIDISPSVAAPLANFSPSILCRAAFSSSFIPAFWDVVYPISIFLFRLARRFSSQMFHGWIWTQAPFKMLSLRERSIEELMHHTAWSRVSVRRANMRQSHETCYVDPRCIFQALRSHAGTGAAGSAAWQTFRALGDLSSIDCMRSPKIICSVQRPCPCSGCSCAAAMIAMVIAQGPLSYSSTINLCCNGHWTSHRTSHRLCHSVCASGWNNATDFNTFCLMFRRRTSRLHVKGGCAGSTLSLCTFSTANNQQFLTSATRSYGWLACADPIRWTLSWLQFVAGVRAAWPHSLLDRTMGRGWISGRGRRWILFEENPEESQLKNPSAVVCLVLCGVCCILLPISRWGSVCTSALDVRGTLRLPQYHRPGGNSAGPSIRRHSE